MPASPLIPARPAFAADGTPFSEAYGDVYHAAAGGVDQARQVFLAGNGLPERWAGRERFVVLETGFGFGLNFLATWAAWRADPRRCGRLHYVSAEKHPFSRDDLATLHARLPQLKELAGELREAWPLLVPGYHRLHLDGGRVLLTLLFGDIVESLPRLRARTDALYLDGFAPAKNPDMWSPEVFRALARVAAQAGIQIALDLIAGLKTISGVHGLHILAPGQEEIVPRLVKETGLKDIVPGVKRFSGNGRNHSHAGANVNFKLPKSANWPVFNPEVPSGIEPGKHIDF